MLSFFLAMLVAVNGQECLVTINVNGLPQLQDYRNTDLDMDLISHQHQAIIPSYRFNCCGEITEWGADVHPGGGGDNMMYTLQFQVWRQAPNVTMTGCYSLVGSNTFTAVPLVDQITESLSLLPEQRIQVQPGDVLGFYVETARDPPTDRGVVILRDRTTKRDRDYETEEVWYGNVSNAVIGDLMCPYAVGPGRVLSLFSNAAPVISLSISATQCPSVLLTQTTIPPSRTHTFYHNFKSSSQNLSTISIQPTNMNKSSSVTLGIILAAVVPVIVIIIMTLVVGLCVCTKVKRNRKNEVHMVSNDAYSTGLHVIGTHVEQDTYDYPTVSHLTMDPIDIKGNEAYATIIETKENEVYATNIDVTNIETEVNEAYDTNTEATNIEIRPNVVYAMNITTEQNEAYESFQ